MTDWHCHTWLQKKLVWPTNKAALGVCYQLLCINMSDGTLYTLPPKHNIHNKNGVYQRWKTYALKSNSVSKIHFPAIWWSKFIDLANSKKTQCWGQKGCRQKCLDKSLWKDGGDWRAQLKLGTNLSKKKRIFVINFGRSFILWKIYLPGTFCCCMKKIFFYL